MGPEIFSAFSVVADAGLDPDEITALTGLTPTRSWHVGDHKVRNGVELRPETTAGWRLQVGPTVSVDLPKQVDTLLSLLEPHAVGLREIAGRTGAEIEISVHVYTANQTPIGTLERSLLERILALGADLDIDLYVVDEDYFAEE